MEKSETQALRGKERLNEQHEEKSIIDKLVSASVEDIPESADVETEQVDKAEPEPQQKSELLEKLVKTVPEPAQVETEEAEPETLPEPSEDVKRSVLDQLIGRSEESGTTDRTDPDRPGEADDE